MNKSEVLFPYFPYTYTTLPHKLLPSPLPPPPRHVIWLGVIKTFFIYTDLLPNVTNFAPQPDFELVSILLLKNHFEPRQLTRSKIMPGNQWKTDHMFY